MATRPVTIEEALAELTAYCETLRSPRDPSFTISYRRPECWRRKAMAKNNSPVISYQVQLSVQANLDAHKTGEVNYEWFQSDYRMQTDLVACILDVLQQVKNYYNPPVDDGSDLV